MTEKGSREGGQRQEVVSGMTDCMKRIASYCAAAKGSDGGLVKKGVLGVG